MSSNELLVGQAFLLVIPPKAGIQNFQLTGFPFELGKREMEVLEILGQPVTDQPSHTYGMLNKTIRLFTLR